MKETMALLLLIAVTFTNSYAQDKEDFDVFAKKEKILMLKDYSKKDPVAFRKELNTFLARYNQLSEKEKQSYDRYADEEYYLLADVYALAGDKKNALDFLEKSTDYDYKDLLEDHDLDGLRKEPRFIKLLNAQKNPKSKTLVTLQNAPKYNLAEKDNLPEFTYQSATDSNLTALKDTYHLDSIAGKGTDVSKIINLMEWVHYLIPHDGNKGNPAVKNAMSLITECTRDKKTLNCRGLAILLNEVYLAEGFKSRFVTCLPKDTTDNDCHVITMVWAPSLHKWLWMDPTFMAYIMNEDGQLLSIEEVRERLINNKPLVLNPDANRNRNEIQTKSDYLGWYMSKNLYKLECPVSSQYNYETKEEGKVRAYIQLVPGSTKPQTQIQKDKHGIAVYTKYYTNNPKTFWADPPVATKPVAVLSRSKRDYEQVMENFKKYYNQDEPDSLVNMFSNAKEMKSWLTKDMLDGFRKEFGTLHDYKYLTLTDIDTDEDYAVAIYKMTYDKSVVTMGISIDKNNKMGTFRFSTSSSYIDKQLAKEL